MIFEWIEGRTESKFVEKVNEILLNRGWTPLNGATARILCAFEDGALAGFHVLQLVPHCEPLWVEASYRGTGLAEELADRMLDFMREMNARGFMVIADTPEAQKLCEERGMKKVTSPVYMM